MASEMLYPIMPAFLKSIGFSVLLIGILEGLAEATAGLSKGYFGKLSDSSGRRVPFVQIGYALSSLSKPMMALFVYPLWIFLARTVDRLGKGIRTGARDALLSDEATPQTKAKVFGFHRSMDTLGAVLGPLLAIGYLTFFPGEYKNLFLLAFVPAILASACSWLLQEKPREKTSEQTQATTTPRFFSFLGYWKSSTPEYRKLVGGLLFFSLINSSDIFLLMKVQQAGLDDTAVIMVYVFYNLVFALAAFPIGIVADKLGLKKVFVVGLALFALVYGMMAITTNSMLFFVVFFLYGIYAAATEGIAKAWISMICHRNDTATAIGNYAGLQSICAMIASTLTGILWYKFGATTALMTTAVLSLCIMVYFISVPKPQIEVQE